MPPAVTLGKVLVVRNDKLGDFTLALPAFQLLKRKMPEIEVRALVPEYTKALAAIEPCIDGIVLDPGPGNDGGSAPALAAALRREGFGAVITLFSTGRIGVAVLLARIPERWAPATKLAQLCYNRRVAQRRSRSEKPEYEYNLDLVRHFLREHGRSGDDRMRRPVIALDATVVHRRRRELAATLGLGADARWVFVHPGHGGSANNLSLDQYARVVRSLRLASDDAVVITAGPGEAEQARRLARALSGVRCAVYESNAGLARFVEVVATADLFISGSTGPLHLAGALDRPTVGFFPRRPTSSALRWQTLNSPGRHLAFMPPPPAHERDMASIDVEAAAASISQRFAGTDATAADA